MKRTTMKMTMAIAAAAMFAGAMPVSATRAVPTVNPDSPTRLEKARELRMQAEALFSEPKQWKKAVRLLERSASLREATDPEAYMCLLYAGRIKASLGDLDGARVTLEKAATHALARGSVVEAAHAFVDAAHVAAEDRENVAAADLLGRARLLAESPLLTEEQRRTLTVRL